MKLRQTSGSQQDVGECRISPPYPIEENGKLIGRWPIVLSSAWCGQYRVKIAREQK